MKFEILNAAVDLDRLQWLTLLDQLPADRKDVYFRPEYMQAYAHSSGIEALCAICISDTALFLYPFLKSKITTDQELLNTKGLYDIQSAYGYGGPVINAEGSDTSFLENAWNLFSEWCLHKNIVSEFIRFHPLIDNVKWAPSDMITFKDRITVSMMLKTYESELLETSYYRVHRQMLNKAERMKFSFHTLSAKTELSWFVPLYHKTQSSLQVNVDTQFGIEYFTSLVNGLNKSIWLGVVKQSGEIVAAAMVLEGATFLHSHLMGYRKDIKSAGMTNLLYHGIAMEGAKNGKIALHMGGGLSGDENDPLFKFKKSLGPSRAEFCLGTHIHNQSWYNKLAQNWEGINGSRPKKYLQFYNLPGNIQPPY